MHDPRRHRALGAIVTIRTVERAAARRDLMEAAERERQASSARVMAESRRDAAVAAWQDHLAGAAFQPELAHALAAELVEQANAGVAARDHAYRMTERRGELQDAWHHHDARCRQAERNRKISVRAIARDREERALEETADRVAYAWSRG